MKKLWWLLIALLLTTGFAKAETLRAGPAESDLPSLSEALAMARDGDVIELASGTYDERRERFPLTVDKAVAIRPAEGASPVIVSPMQTTAMKITGRGASVTGLRFDHIRCAIWVLADDVSVRDLDIRLTDEAWRTSSCGLWLAGAKRAFLTGNSFTGCGIALAGPPISESSVGIPVLTAMFEVGEDIEFFTTHTIRDNYVNGKPLIFLNGEKDLDWSREAGQIVAVNCEEMRFSGLNVDFASIGIQLAYCVNVSVENCSANDNGIFGVYVMKTQGCAITDTRASRGAHGIDIRDADNVLVARCVTNDCGQGTFLSWGRNCLTQDCEIVGNGTGFFSASGGDNHVHRCRIENNELGLYIQHEALFTLTDTQVCKNSACGLRATDSGVISLRNCFTDNFVGHLALDCSPLTYMDCVYTRSEDCDIFIRGGRTIKLMHNTFDGDMAKSVAFQGSETPLVVE